MKAVIMAGGEGTRLRPLTCGIPKPMVPIANKPVMEHIVNHIRKAGIKDIAVTTAYLPAAISDYFEDGAEWGVNLKYYIEESPLGTGGSVKNAEDFLDDTFIIISGDALTDIDINQAIDFHKKNNSKATLVLKKVDIPLEYGVVITDERGRIIRFLEKPSWGEVFSDTINTGIYVLEPEVLNYYKKGDNFDFSKDLFPKLLADDVPMFGYISKEYWNDIGDLRVYNEVCYDILNGKIALVNEYTQLSKGIWVGQNTVIEEGCELIPPVYIGNNNIIRKGTHITESIIGDNCEISENCSIKRSAIWKNCDLSPNVHCRGTVICNNVYIKNSVNIFENTVVGSNTLIMSGATVKPDIRIWPEKIINEDAIVNQNMVWGSKISKALFGFRDISGDINTELSPEFCSKLGSAFGSMFKDNSKLVISTDESNAAKVVRDSIISGILSTGIKVIDIGSSALPISRFAVRFYRADGGIHIRKDFSLENFNKIHIEIVNQNGVNIERSVERKIENIFARGDFKRCNSDRIKEITRVPNFIEFYIQNGANMLTEINLIRKKQFKLVAGSRSAHLLFLAAAYLESIGCNVIIDYSANNFDANSQLNIIAEQVVKQGAEIGILFSEDGESAVLIDHQGRVIDSNKYMMFAAFMILKKGKENRLVLPYTASNKIEKLADKYDAKVIRTKSVPSEIMKEMVLKSPINEEYSQQYLLHYDAIRGVGIIIDFLVTEDRSLNDIIKELPDLHMEKNEIKCDWKHKGSVIRKLTEDMSNKNIELFEGVKIFDENGWVLILPDSEKPLCNIYTEGASEEYARELAAIYSDKISGMISTEI